MKVAIVKYNAGNVFSVETALQRLGVKSIVSDNPDELSSADRVIFPGVGEASTAMNYLKSRNLDSVIRNLKNPVLGICLGLQLLCQSSAEGATKCLGVFNHEVVRFNISAKVPQVGWNSLQNLKGGLFSGLTEGAYCYFVHSYYANLGPATCAETLYDLKFSSALQKDNFFAVQFHPEKSAEVGERILKNFLSTDLCK